MKPITLFFQDRELQREMDSGPDNTGLKRIRSSTVSLTLAIENLLRQLMVPGGSNSIIFRPSSRVQRELITEQPGQLLVSKMTPMQGILEVYQLYIPGLGYPHFQFHKNFSMLSAEQIPTG